MTKVVEDGCFSCYSCQVLVIGNGKLSDLVPVKRLSHWFGYKRGTHSLSVCTLVHRPSFVVQSVAIVNIDKSFRL